MALVINALLLQELNHGLANLCYILSYRNTYSIQSLDLVSSSTLAACNNSTGMAHALARRRLSTGNEANYRLVRHVLSNPLGSIFLSSAANLTNHDESQGIIIILKELQGIDEVSTLYRVAADTYSSGLAKACRDSWKEAS